MLGHSEENTLNPHFRDMLSALCAENVEFMVVGAYALAAHGLVRATGDIDIWVRPTKANAERTWRALEQFKAPLFDLTIDDLWSDDVVFQIGIAPHRIDILTSITGVSFDDAWTRRKSHLVEGLEIAVIGRDDLLTNKRKLVVHKIWPMQSG